MFWIFVVLVGVPVFGVLTNIILSTFTNGGGTSDRVNTVALKSAQAVSLKPTDELVSALSIFSSYTDVEKDRIKDEMRGKIVQWTLPVWNVSKSGDDGYIIQTSSSAGIGTFCKVEPADHDQAKIITMLRAGSPVTCKGAVSGFTLGSVNISPAIVVAE